MKSTLDEREFASHFEKYRRDKNNFSLYIWGHAMILLDLYMTNDMLLHDPEGFEIEDLGEVPYWIKLGDPSEWIYYGEPEIYPQFAIVEAQIPR